LYGLSFARHINVNEMYVGHVTRMVEMRNACQVSVGKSKGGDCLGNTGRREEDCTT
jgi:hypothetical protein